MASIVATGEVAAIAPDDVDETHAPAVEAFRLGVLALGRLKDYDALASAVLDQKSLPRVTWWPVAAAFQRVEDRRAAYVLMAFARGESRFGRAFAARGLGALKDPAAVDALVPLAKDWARDTGAAVAAVKALGSIGDRRAGPVLIELLQTKGLDPLLRLEVIGALASTRAAGAFDLLLPLAEDPVPAVRAAVFTGLRAIDPQSYMVMLSGLDADPDWRVRSAIASSLSALERDAAEPRLTAMLKDADLRVIPAVLSALVKIKAERLEPLLLEWLTHEDVVIRSAAASGIGELKPAGGDRALVDAFHAASRDDAYGARTAALDALVKYGPEVARPVLREALADKDWAVRVHAAALLAPIEPSADLAAAIRPAPTGRAPSFYDERELITPTVSPRVYIDTSRGRIEIEMAVLDAPLTCLNFMTLARQGVLQRRPLAPRRAELRRAGRRPEGRRRGRARLHDPRRDQRAAVPARDGGDGARVGGHGRQPVLPDALPAAAPRRPLHGVRADRARPRRAGSHPAGRHDRAGAGVGREDDGGDERSRRKTAVAVDDV